MKKHLKNFIFFQKSIDNLKKIIYDYGILKDTKERGEKMNTTLLKSKMVLFGDTNTTLGKALGIAYQTVSAKINNTNGAEFTQGEILKIKNRYELTPKEVDEIFLTNKYLKKDTNNAD